MHRAVVWQVEDGPRFHFRRWGEACVAYDRASGDTHLLDPLAAEVLAAAQEAPATGEELARRVASRLGTAVDADALPALDPLLGELERLALIRRAPQ